MQICLTAHNQERQKFDFSAALYRTLTVSLPSRRITVDFQTGQVFDQPAVNESPIKTIKIVDEFKRHQERRGLSQSTIDTYRPVLAALANFAPDWPPSPTIIDTFLDGYQERKCSKVTLAEYWGQLNT